MQTEWEFRTTRMSWSLDRGGLNLVMETGLATLLDDPAYSKQSLIKTRIVVKTLPSSGRGRTVGAWAKPRQLRHDRYTGKAPACSHRTDYSARREIRAEEATTGALAENDEKTYELDHIHTCAGEPYLSYMTVRLRDFIQGYRTDRYVAT
jgi:hypothetical protein